MNSKGQASLEIILVTAFVIVTTLLIVVMWLDSLGDTFIISRLKLDSMDVLSKASETYTIRKIESDLLSSSETHLELNLYLEPGGFQLRHPDLVNELKSLENSIALNSRYESISINVINAAEPYPGFASSQGAGGGAPSSASLNVSFSEGSNVSAGQAFKIIFSINNVSDLWGTQLRLNYQGNLMSCSSFNRGGFMGSSDAELLDTSNNPFNYFEYIASRRNSSVNGSGSIVEFNCTANASGTASFTSSFSFTDSQGFINVSTSSIPSLNIS